MDRNLDQKVRRWLLVRRMAITALPLALLVGAFLWGSAWLKPTVSRSRIRTALVISGPVEAGISATGMAIPELNLSISSPIDARVIRILKRPGDILNPGDAILELDVEGARLSLDRVRQNLALKRNAQTRTRIDLEHTLIDLQSHCRIKDLERQSIRTRVIQNRRLFENGLVSAEEVKRAESEEARAEIEWQQLLESKRNAELSTRAQEEGLVLEMAILEKEEKVLERDLDLATTKADRRGVLTWVVTEEGLTVRKGEVIARLADLSSFHVEARVSDVHASLLKPGMPARVSIDESLFLAGTITQVLPTIENGVVTFQVTLEEKSHPALRSNLRVDVVALAERKAHVLRVPKGPSIAGDNTRAVFVIRGATAILTPVRIGMAGVDGYEVLHGLLEGDEVILSDMTEWMHLKEISVRN